MNKTHSLAKIYLLQTLQTVMQTSNATTAQVCKDEATIHSMTSFLLETCRVSEADLFVIAHALDAFFDIYAEAYYNPALVQLNVI